MILCGSVENQGRQAMDKSDYDGEEAFTGLGEEWDVIKKVLPDR